MTRSDRAPPRPARGGTCMDLRALTATVEDALTASLGRFTMKGGFPGSGALTKIECSPTRAPSPSPPAEMPRNAPALAGRFGAGVATIREGAPGLPPNSSPLATVFGWLVTSAVVPSPDSPWFSTVVVGAPTAPAGLA